MLKNPDTFVIVCGPPCIGGTVVETDKSILTCEALPGKLAYVRTFLINTCLGSTKCLYSMTSRPFLVANARYFGLHNWCPCPPRIEIGPLINGGVIVWESVLSMLYISNVPVLGRFALSSRLPVLGGAVCSLGLLRPANLPSYFEGHYT